MTVTPLFRVMINLWSRQHSGVVQGMLAIVTRRSLSPERLAARDYTIVWYVKLIPQLHTTMHNRQTPEVAMVVAYLCV